MQNIKLSYSTPDYKIEGNKVICTIHFYFKKEIIRELLLLENKKLLNFLSNNLNITLSDVFNIALDNYYSNSNPYFNFIMVREAKCHPNDSFNEKLGKQIAKAKCLIAANKRFETLLKIVSEYYYEQYKYYNVNFLRRETIYQNKKDYLKKLIK